MSQENRPKLITPSSPSGTGGQSASQGQQPPIDPRNQLPPPQGPGARPWIIIGVLLLLIGGGLWGISAAKKSQEAEREANEKKEADKKQEEPVARKPAPKSVVRSSVKADDRPAKKEMKTISTEKPNEIGNHLEEWVILEGKVSEGNEDGILKFENLPDFQGKLSRGNASHLDDQLVRVIGWLIDEETLQIDGIEDVETIRAVDLLPKKSLYTSADLEQLEALKGDKVNYKGLVKELRQSPDKKKFFLVFDVSEDSPYQFWGEGVVKELEEGIDQKALEALVGKKVKISGKLGNQKADKKTRVTIRFKKRADYSIVFE